MPGHRGAGVGVPRVQGTRRRQRGPRGPCAVPCAHGGGAGRTWATGTAGGRRAAAERRAVGRLGQPDPAREVDGGGAGRGERVGRLVHVGATGRGQRHPVRARQAEQRRSPDGERQDRLHQRRGVRAHQLRLLRRKPRLVEKHQYRAFGRFVPTDRGSPPAPRSVTWTPVLISHSSSLPRTGATNEGPPVTERPVHPVRPATRRGTMAAVAPPRPRTGTEKEPR